MLENYKSLDKIGEGGYGEVYKAQDSMGRTVAIKVLRNMSGDNVERFRSEMKILAQLKHDHIVKIFDGKIGGDQNYIAMEYINAKSLQALVEENGPFSPKKDCKNTVSSCTSSPLCA